MAPKAKTGARVRAVAKSKAVTKGAGKGLGLDDAAERANFQRFSDVTRGHIQALAVRMANSFDIRQDVAIEIRADALLPVAVRASREMPHLLTTESSSEEVTPLTVSRGARIIYHGSDLEAIHSFRQEGDVISRPDGGILRLWVPEIAFALNNRGMQLPIPNGMALEWLVAMFPGQEAPENKWYQIPESLLHSNFAVVYVNFHLFMEENTHVFRGLHEPDNRPLLTPLWREEHPEEWQRLWDQQPRDQCPVCLEKPDIWDGPMNSGVPTRCNHFACVDCWGKIFKRDRRCPICRDNLSLWLRRFEAADRDESEGE